MTTKIVQLCATVAVGGLMAASAYAQATATPAAAATAESAPSEIVVTAARRRNEDVQKTPLAVTALNSQVLQDRHVTSLADVGKLAPNLQITKSVSTSDVATIYLRGFGTYGADIATEPKVAVFLDGIYQPAAIGTLLDTFDVQQIEVQAGPQGTLLGKNAPIGAIYVTSERPDGKLDATIQADYGSYQRYAVRAKANFPIFSDSDGNSILAGRVSYIHTGGGDWIRNLYTGKRNQGGSDDNGGRVSLRFTPGTRFDWNLTGVAFFSRGPQTGARAGGDAPAVLGDKNTVAQPASAECFFVSCAPTPYGTTASGNTGHNHGDVYQIASTMNYKFDPATLTFVSGYNKYKRLDNEDVDGTPASLLDVFDSHANFKQESGELRLGSNKGGGLDLNGHLDWVIGAFASHFQYFGENRIAILSPNAGGTYTSPGLVNTYQAEFGKTNSEAVFAQAIVHITDALSSTLGIRESWDQKWHSYIPPTSANRFFDSKLSFRNTSFEAGLAYQVDRNLLVYGRFAEGYAAGGFIGFPGCDNCGSSYLPEKNKAIEAGIKSEWFDHRLRFNINYFHNKLNDLQVEGTIPTATPPFYIQSTTNAASATVQGIETQISINPVHGFYAHANAGYLDAKYKKYIGTACSNAVGVDADCSGLPFALAPKYTADFGAEYVFDQFSFGEFKLAGNWNYRSTAYTADAPAPSSRQPGYGLLGLSLAFTDPDKRWTAEVYGTNVLNKKYIIASTAVAGLLVAYNDGRPAEFGLRLTYKFGR